jgi:hypothetical protein
MTIPGLPDVPPRQEPTEELRAIIRLADGAADYELLCTPTPVSSVRNPDGLQQSETMSERTRRIVETAIMYAVENGLLVVPEGTGEKLADYFPAQRARA